MSQYDMNMFNEDVEDINNTINKPFFNVEVTPTRKCNMGCTYCFESIDVAKHQTNFTNPDDFVDSIIQKITALKNSDKFKELWGGINIGFWGGEPSLNPSFFDKVVKTFGMDSDVVFHIYTNGLNHKPIKSTIDWLCDNKLQPKFDIQISYDGSPINDLNRVTVGGKPTGHKPITSAMELASLGFKNVKLKATLEPKDFKYLNQVWDDYELLNKSFREEFGEDQYPIMYAPTIEHHNHGGESYNDVWQSEMLKIAKKEIQFYKETGMYLMGWIGASKTVCSAGKTMGTFDIDGKYYVCHGAMYSDDQEELQIASVNDTDEDFINKLIDKSNDIGSCSTDDIMPPECVDCSATYCAQCNVVEYSSGKAKASSDEWLDRWNTRGSDSNMCQYFKYFGKLDIAIKHKIRNGE